MSDTNTAVNVDATDSAPVADDVNQSVNAADSGTADTDVQATSSTAVDDGSAPVEDKRTKELISTRRRAQDAERENQLLKQLLEQAVQPPRAVPEPHVPVQQDLKKPVADDYDTWEAYETAQESYLIEKSKREAFHEIQKYQQQQMQLSQQQRLEATWQDQLNKAAAADPTLLDIINDQTLPIPNHVAEMIKQSDVGTKILKHLDGNRELAQKIALSHPINAAMEIGRIVATLKAAPPAAPPPRVSQAPEPIKPVNAVGSPVVDETKMTTDDWIAMRNQQQFGQRRK